MFISIYNRANTLIYSGNCEVKQKFRVMGEETSTITIVSESVISFNYGDYVDVRGDRFYLHTNPKKSDSGAYLIYTLSFESVKYKLFGVILQSFGRAKFDITTDLEGWCKLIVDNANRTDSGWSYVINEPLVGFKTLVVEGETCLSAVNRIFSEFKKEFRFVGKQLVVGRVGADLSNVLKVGRYQGAYQVTEEQDGTASPVTRLYVYGSDRNLPVKYNNADGTTPTDRLTIKAVNGGLAYIDDAAKIALYGVIEGSYINEDIYPHRTGTISAIDATSIQNFIDSSIDFDINAQLLPGIAAKVTFVSGDLSGYTFDVVSYNATTKQVRIAIGNDGSGKELPNTVFKPKVGDKYVFTDIAMPQSYITAGENDLKSDGLKEYARVSGWQRNFKLTAIDPTYQQDLNFYPAPGDKFGITSEGIVQQVRIVEYGINLTTEVPIYDGVQLADKVEPSLAQQGVNSATQTSSSVYMANKSATTAQVCAVNANSSATNAALAAELAQQAANVANGSITDMCSDDKVTSIEKQMFKREWEIIVSEKDKNVQQADTFGVSRTAYVNAYNDLLAFLGTNLNDLTTTWDLGTGGGVTLRSKFKGYYDARTDLLNGIALKAKQAADAAQNAVNTVQQGALMKNSASQQVVNSPVQFVGQVQINGDIIQNGAAYETHAQHVYTSDDFITLRDGAVGNLAAGSFTGFRSKRVFGDGTDGYLVFGSDGMARVGKQGSLQMLATREDTPKDGSIQYWSATEKQMKSGVLASSLFYEGDALVSNVDFATIVGNRSHFNEVGNGSGNTNIPDPYGTLVSFGGSSFGGKLHFPPDVNDYAGLKWMPKHENYPASWHTIYDTHNANLPSVDWACRNLTANGQIVSSTSTGNINIGSQNSSWIHFFSTLPNYFSQRIRAVDSIGVYDADNYIHNNGLLLTQGDARIAGVVKSINQNGSGFTATGWQIGDDSNLNNLDVRSRLQVYEFVQNKININNGNLIVTDSAKVDSIWFWVDGGVSGIGQHVRYSFTEQHPFKVGDIIRCQSKGKSYIVTVGFVSPNGLIFDAYNSYNNAGVSASAAGDLLIRWDSNDANRKGLLYLNSSDTNAPNFQVVHGGAVKGCFGNCAGLNWQGAPLPANSWGTWIDNGWFNGAVNANSGNIGGFSIDSYQLHTGTNSAGLIPKIRLSNSNVTVNDGYVYTGNRVLEGLSLTWHRSSNAGHLVFGQLAANGNTLKDGFKGIQMMDWLGNEYFALGANVNVENYSSHYCKIAGWNFDTLSIHKGLRWGANGRGVGMYSEGNFSVISAHKDNNNYVALFDNVGMQGFDAVYGGSSIFRITDTQKYIAGWNFDSFHLYSGYLSLNANGAIEHTGGKWALNNNGSGKLASGNITWDDAGNANFTGTINARAGNFTGTVNAASGNIGGFNISNSILNATGSLMNLSLDAAQGIITLAGKSNWSALTAGIGKYVHPYRPEMVAAAYFKNNVSDASGKIRNVGIIVESSNANNNVSIQAQGNIVCSNDVFGYGYSYYTLSAGAVQPLFIFNSSKFLIKSYGTCQVYIPDVFVVADSLNIKVPSSLNLAEMDDFWITISIVAKYDSAGFYVLTGSNWTGKDRNGNTFTSFLMAGGDSAVLHLIKKGSEAIVQWAATIS